MSNGTKRIITATINGNETTMAIDNRMSLLQALRDVAGMTGTKEGCLTGDCGACSVILNGRVVDSCLVMAAEADGAQLETVEGMARGQELHPLQTQFLEHAALQCGICTPGFLVAAKALLDRNPNPTEEEIRYWLAGNLCRCTGYRTIIEAVQDAAAELKTSAR
ncbi:MAG TPA: (2Fe-2S)-binding protein [bacterium]|nr:(2Fe-2S)-binding protein [bacterium]